MDSRAFDATLRRLIQEDFDQRERACEAALQTGTMGVRIDEDGRAHPDPDVPYGVIHDYSRYAAGHVNHRCTEAPGFPWS